MKKLLGVFLAPLLVSGLILSGCTETASETAVPPVASEPETTTAPANSSATTPEQTTKSSLATAAETSVIELKNALVFPAQTTSGELVQTWADMIAEQTGGRVKINNYFGQSLLNASEISSGVQGGIADFGCYTPGTESGILDLNSFINLNFMGWPSSTAANEIYQELLNTFPELEQEYEKLGFKLYRPCFMPGYNLDTRDKIVRVPKDVSGMKIITGGPLSKAVQAGGGAPLDVPISEYYTSLERGLADGVVTHLAGNISYGTLDLLPYHNIFDNSGICMRQLVVIINLSTWKSLPADIQKVFEDIEPWYIEAQDEVFAGELGYAMAMAQQANHTFTYLTPDEIQLWADIYATEGDEWVAESAANGPAQEIYDEAKRLIAAYTAE